ncbi:MAG: alpha/beta fold hydrolase [Pseudomonadota bacterium]
MMSLIISRRIEFDLLRGFRLSLLSLLVGLALSACANRPATLPEIDPANFEGNVKDIFVVTNRAPIEDDLIRFGDERSDTVSYEEVSVWTPQDRPPGSVVYPSKQPDPSEEFAVTGITDLDADAFDAALKQRVDAMTGQKLVFIFVHGYNVAYANGIYRHAQLLEDFEARGVAIHFSWPSSGQTLGYLYDRDSVQFARDALVDTIRKAAASGADSIFLMGHSMGTLLVMESLRQLSIAGDDETLDMIGPLVLASPDIDIDVFRSQFEVLSHRPEPFVIFVSKEDGALSVSERLRGGRARVGTGSNIAVLQDNGIVVIDLSELDVGVGTKHAAFASSPALIRALKEVNISQQTQVSADRAEDRFAPLLVLRDLTAGIVHLPREVARGGN